MTNDFPTGWKNGWDGDIRIASGGKETPFLQDGRWFLLVFSVKDRKHLVYDFANDLLLDEMPAEFRR